MELLNIQRVKGPRTYLARVSKEVKFHFRSMVSSSFDVRVANLRAGPANLKTLRGNLFLSGGLPDDIEM